MLSDELLLWYDEHHRNLPWRESRDPWHIWVSQIMLQQTRVETVIPYFKRFLNAFPTPQSLANADQDDVLKLWQGLGYYSRARNLQKGAQQICESYQGQIPGSYEELLKISGIGEYTAGAIASIAFSRAVPAIDGNAIRVFSRVAALEQNVAIPSVKRRLRSIVEQNISNDRPGDFNQAVMDLGSGICTPGTPDCDCCPIASYCIAHAEDIADSLPVLPQKKPPVEEAYDVVILYSGDRTYLTQRTQSLLRNMWVFPMFDGHHDKRTLQKQIQERYSVKTGLPAFVGQAKHVFTHRVWQMNIYSVQLISDIEPVGITAAVVRDIERLAIPTAMKAAKTAALSILKGNSTSTID